MSEPNVYRIRASSWASLFDCAYKFEGEQLLGMRRPSSPRATLGKAFHAGTAAFDTARMLGTPITVDDAAGVLVDAIQRPDEDVEWRRDDLNPRETERIALQLHVMYCTTWSPRFDWEAVELEVTPLTIDCGDGIAIQLTGTLDRMRLARTGSGHGIADLKTGRTAVQKGVARTKGFRAQIGTYELLSEHTTGKPITDDGQIIGAKTEGKPEIATGPVRDAKQLLVGDGETPGLIEHAQHMLRTGYFPPNPSSHLCDARYCARWATCIYHD